MSKAFLSHSSKDKKTIIDNVVKHLKKDNIHYDQLTFEEGERTVDEIAKALDSTDLFVLFISDTALNSTWVREEIFEAKNKLDNKEILKIYPIIIDDSINHRDERIPDWLKKDYNLKPIKSANIIARRINSKLRQLSIQKNQINPVRDTFVGRTNEMRDFEKRIHDFDLNKPKSIFISGVNGVGRKTFLKHALVKTNLIELGYKPSILLLEKDASIEDFIHQLNGLGLVDLTSELTHLDDKSMVDKINIVKKFISQAQNDEEVIFIVDEGSIVNFKREISDWFQACLEGLDNVDIPIFCVISRFRVNFKNRLRNKDYYFIELNELDVDERKWLLTQLLKINKIQLDKKDFNDIQSLLFGLPEQVYYAVDLLKTDNISKIVDKLPFIREYNDDTASLLLRKYEDDSETIKFIRFLAEFEVINIDFIYSVLPIDKANVLIEKLASEHIVELIGIEGEIVRLSDIVRDYITRNNFKLDNFYKEKIKSKVSEILKANDIFDYDTSEYIFALKEGLKEGNPDIDTRFLIPSHYLKCMKDLYHKKTDYNRVITLADKILQKEDNIDKMVVRDIRYYLCLTLARQKDDRFREEVQKIDGDEHNFLFGYYYRLTDRLEDSLNRLLSVIDKPYVGTRAKRELVQVYVQLEEYDKALEYAKKNYEENKGNQFHTQAYFNCLINSENCRQHSEILKSLINNLEQIDSEQSKEMSKIAQALYFAKVDSNSTKAFDHIEDCASSFPTSIYPLLAQCDIAVMYKNKEKLDQGIENLRYSVVSPRTMNKYKAYSSVLGGNLTNAYSMIAKDLERLPLDTQNKIKEKLKNYLS